MMWVIVGNGTMAAMTPAMMPVMTPEKGMAGMPAGRGEGAPGGGRGSSGSACGGCILQGLFAFYFEDIYFCVVFL
jgi:hypothetical protein